MLNPDLKLNKDILAKDESKIEQLPIRKGFGQGLLAAAEKDKNIVGLCADLTESTQMHLFKEKFPNRFVEIGVAEQNMASVASGMAAMGKIPVISSYAVFSPGRNWEQIRTTICYNDRKVIIAGSHAGVSVGPDGGSHQALEDIAITRVLPNMTVFSPCDSIEARKITELALTDAVSTPTYIRLAREKTPVITTDESPLTRDTLFKAKLLFLPTPEIIAKKEKAEVGIIVTGSLTYNALRAADELENEGIAVKVLNIPSIKPIDMESIINLAIETRALVTVEEHQINGGLGSVVAEVIVQNMTKPALIEFIGVRDLFGQSGTPKELIKHYGMDISDIKEATKRVLKKKMSSANS